MAILDFLWGGKAKRTLAKRLLDEVEAPFDRLHAMIAEAGSAEVPDFEGVREGFADCRTYRPAELAALPIEDRAALDRVVAGVLPAIGPLHAEVRAAFERVLAEWPREGLANAAAKGGLRALGDLEELARPRTDQDRLFRTAAFLDVDTACSDIRRDLAHIAEAPSLFW